MCQTWSETPKTGFLCRGSYSSRLHHTLESEESNERFMLIAGDWGSTRLVQTWGQLFKITMPLVNDLLKFGIAILQNVLLLLVEKM